MKLAQQWNDILGDLPSGWAEARLSLEVRDDAQLSRAAALLGPAGPGRSGHVLRFTALRSGGPTGIDAVTRLLGRLDEEAIAGTLTLAGAEQAVERPEPPRRTLVEDWDGALARLPADWSDVYAELALRSSADIDRSALALAPMNPSRPEGELALRFRVARVAGYGASPAMARTRLAKLDALGVQGTVRILRTLSATEHAYTLGPVWYVEGKVV